MTPIPASDPLLLALARAQAQHRLFPARQPVVVAVSGGADSVCLLHALVQMADTWGLALHVAHINHGLRPHAAAESEFVASLAHSLGLPLHIVRLDPQALRANPAGLEAAARNARYTALCQIARQVTPDNADLLPCIAVAHHADDQAETVLLRLAQGSGLQGLAGLRSVTTAPVRTPAGERPVRLVRPLLGVTRNEILAYLARCDLTWVEDESNADLRFARNRLRHMVLPALAAINPGIVATLCRNAEVWAEDAERLAALDAAALAQLNLEPPSAERVVLDLAAWQGLPPAERRGVLRAAFAHLEADARQLGAAQLQDIVRRAAPAPTDSVRSSGPHPLPGGLAWSVIGAANGNPARLCLHTAAAPPIAAGPQLDAGWRAAQGEIRLPLPGSLAIRGWRLAVTLLAPTDLPPNWQTQRNPWRLFADAAALAHATLTTPRPGLRLAPLGMGGRRRRLVELFRSRKVPPSLRQGWPLLVDCRDGQVLWVCGLQPAESLRITERTNQVALLEWQAAEV